MNATLWTAVARLLMIAVFTQSIFAGLLLSGELWGRTAHRATAFSLTAATLVAGIVALLTLRRNEHGPRFAASMLLFAAALIAQTVVGLRAANGERLLWLHVPLGVALTGFAAQLEASARRLRWSARRLTPGSPSSSM